MHALSVVGHEEHADAAAICADVAWSGEVHRSVCASRMNEAKRTARGVTVVTVPTIVPPAGDGSAA